MLNTVMIEMLITQFISIGSKDSLTYLNLPSI